MATALYRRYRPETFSEMIGQAHVTEPLMTALRSERIGHAYLFSGPRGCGKTTSARVLARCLNCAQGPTDTPCGTCPSCIDLSRQGGGSLDVVEIDAASHGGVDDARELRERAVFAPARDRYKIFIIDEAHMVTAAGFNALLKIVEEPPPHVKFIFATTEPEKVIGTIRSRTHHYPFRLIAPGVLIDYAQTLCESEGITVEEGVLPLVVRAGGGSVRDTLSILDQLIAGSEGPHVATARAAGLLGFTSTELIDEVVAALAAADPAVAFAAVDRVVQTGQDPRRFVEDLLERLRDLIVIGATSVDGAAGVFRGVPEAQLNRMFQQSLSFARGELSRLADLVSAALDSMAGATAPRLHLELMIARALVGTQQGSPAAGAATTNAAAGSPASAPSGGSFAEQLSAARAATSAQSMPQPAPPSAAPQQAAPQPVVPAGQPAAPVHQPAPHTPTHMAPAPSNPVPAAAPKADAPHAATPPMSHSGLTPPLPETPVYPPGQSPADFVNAMRSARDFLKNDTAGATPKTAPAGAPQQDAPQRPQNVPEPATAPVAESAAHRESPITQAVPAAEVAPPTPVEPEMPRSTVAEVAVTLADLADVWGDILDELRETDQAAWAAISPVQPLDLTNEVLTVGLANSEDLNRFKSDGAGPLRDAIDGALGIQVKYVPKQVAGTSGDARAPRPNAPSASPNAMERVAEPAEDPDPATGHTPQSPAPATAAAPPAPAAVPMPETAAAPRIDPLEQRLGRVLGNFAAGAPSPVPAPTQQPPVAQQTPMVSPTVAPRVSTAPRVQPSGAPTAALPVPANEPYPEPPADPYDYPPEDPYGGYPSPGNEPALDATHTTQPPSMPLVEHRATDPQPTPSPALVAAPLAGTGTTTAAVQQPRTQSDTASGRSAEPSPAQPNAQPSSPAPIGHAAPSIRAAAPSSPSFVRYGEAVVREVLGARFIEERPFDTPSDSAAR